MFQHHRITAASRYAWSADGQWNLISCCGWLIFIQAALFGSVDWKQPLNIKYHGVSFSLKVMVTLVLLLYHVCHWVFCSVCVARPDRNVEWKFHQLIVASGCFSWQSMSPLIKLVKCLCESWKHCLYVIDCGSKLHWESWASSDMGRQEQAGK